MPQILLTKQLVVNLGKDEHGQQKTVTLPAGVQEVDAEIADHWFVKAHAQEITPSVAINQELQDKFDALVLEHIALGLQSNAATQKIGELEAQAKTLTADLGFSNLREVDLNKKLSEAVDRENAQSSQITDLIKQAEADAKTIADLTKQIADSTKVEAQAKPDPKAK